MRTSALLAGFRISDSGNEAGNGGTPWLASPRVNRASSPQSMSTSGDSVMQVSDAAGGLVDNMMVCFTSKDVIFFFKKSPNGSVLPRTVTGISNGKNRIEVLDAADSALMRASLTLAN